MLEGAAVKQICFVVSHPMTAVVFLVPHLKALTLSYRVHVVANSPDVNLLRKHGLDVDLISVPIERSIRPIKDFRALLALFRLFRRHQFDAVHSVTPKAGLLAMTAAWLARIRVRVHVFTGQVWATRSGFGRRLLKAADQLIASLSTCILVDSASQRDFLLRERVIQPGKSKVLAQGSISGVDTERFRPDSSARLAVRKELHIPEAAVLLLYLGRLNADKGIIQLAEAFSRLAPRFDNVWLLLVGRDEEGMQQRVNSICADCLDRVARVDFTYQPERYMASADIFCLPSYREGFGSSVIEAAACGVPAVASRIYGLTDAVEDGVTGLLREAGDVDSLLSGISELIQAPQSRTQMGLAARRRVQEMFRQEHVTAALVEFYEQLFDAES
jgi:glycosyltransferase involved in cell wall biosynthesis